MMPEHAGVHNLDAHVEELVVSTPPEPAVELESTTENLRHGEILTWRIDDTYDSPLVRVMWNVLGIRRTFCG
jgi:hypothetical protein